MFRFVSMCLARFGNVFVVVIFLRINARLDFLRGMMRWLEIFISLFSYV